MLSFISNLGPLEIVLILIAAVLIFGRNLPEVAARGAIQVQKLRKGVRDFKRESGFDEEVRRARELIEDPVRQALKELDSKADETKRPFVGQHPEAQDMVEADEGGANGLDGAAAPDVVTLEAAGRTLPPNEADDVPAEASEPAVEDDTSTRPN